MSAAHDLLGDAHQLVRPALPVLPPGLSRLLTLLSDERISVPELVPALETFPAIAAQIVALANSAWVAPRWPLTSLSDACAMLGLTVVRSVSLALAVARPFSATRCPAFDARRFWCVALLTAEGAALLAPGLQGLGERVDVGTLRTAGLVHQLGLLWMADGWPLQAGAAFEMAARGTGVDLITAQRSTCGTDYCEMGGALAQAWQLPAALTTTMVQHRSADYRGPHAGLVAGVGAAAAMAHRVWRRDAAAEHRLPPRWPALDAGLLEEVGAKVAGQRESVLALAETVFEG